MNKQINNIDLERNLNTLYDYKEYVNKSSRFNSNFWKDTHIMSQNNYFHTTHTLFCYYIDPKILNYFNDSIPSRATNSIVCWL